MSTPQTVNQTNPAPVTTGVAPPKHNAGRHTGPPLANARIGATRNPSGPAAQGGDDGFSPATAAELRRDLGDDFNGASMRALRAKMNANQIMREGTHGDDVARLQTMLKKQGYDLGHSGLDGSGVDGRYGILTERAVRDFQTKQHLRIDGRAGQETIGRLKLGPTGEAVNANQLKPGEERHAVSGGDGVQVDAHKTDAGKPEATLTAPSTASQPATVTGSGTGQTVAVTTANGSAAMQLTGNDHKAAGFNGAAGDHQIVTMDRNGGTDVASTPATVRETGTERVTTTPGTTSTVTRDRGMYEWVADHLFGTPQSTQTNVVDQRRIVGGYQDTVRQPDGTLKTVDHTRLSTTVDDLDAQRMQTAMDMAKDGMDPKKGFFERWGSLMGASMMMGGGE